MEIPESPMKVKSSWLSRHHMLLMVLCCLVPIGLIIALKLAGVQSSLLSSAAVLICPLSMVMMMFWFMRKKGADRGPVQ